MEGNHPDPGRAARIEAAWESFLAREKATTTVVEPDGRKGWGCLLQLVLHLVRVAVGGVVVLVMGVLHPLAYLWDADGPGPLTDGVGVSAVIWWWIAAAIVGWRPALGMLPLGSEMLRVATRSAAMTSGGRATAVSGAAIVARVVGMIVALGGALVGAVLIVSVIVEPQSDVHPGAAGYITLAGFLALCIGLACLLLLVRGARRHRALQARLAAAPAYREGRPIDP